MKRLLWQLGAALACLMPTQPALAANSSVKVSVCTATPQVSITLPLTNSTTSNASITVSGTTDAGSTIILKRNGSQIAQIAVGSSGSFGVSAALVVGENQLQAHSQISGCSEEANSEIVIVNRTVAPAPSGGSNGSSNPEPSDGTGTTGGGSSSPTGGTSSGGDQDQQPEPGTPAPPLLITFPPNDYTTTNSSTVLAGQAAPNSEVTIYINDSFAAEVSTDENGNFSVRLELSLGKNTISLTTDDPLVQGKINIQRLTPTALGRLKPTSSGLKHLAIILVIYSLGGLIFLAAKRRHHKDEPVPPAIVKPRYNT